MRREMGKRILLGLLAAVTALTVEAAARADGAWITVELSNDTAVSLDVTGWADDGEVSLLETSGYETMKETLRDGIARGETSISVKNSLGRTITAQDCFQIYRNTLMDYPEQTWMAALQVSIKYTSLSDGATLRFLPMYLTDCDPEAYRQAVDEAAARCFTGDMTPLEKVASAYDWLVDYCQYDPFVCRGGDYTTAGGVTYTEDDMVYTSYGAFVNRNAVCQGYAMAFKVLMDRGGVDCCVVTNSDHAWNMVQLDGKWYHVDATWDDPLYGTTGDVPGRVGRTYFLRSDAEFLNPQDGANIHAAWSSEYGYTASVSYALPQGLASAQTAAMQRIGGDFWLVNTDGALCRYAVGSGFTNGTVVLEDLDTIIASAYSQETGALYLLSNWTRALKNGKWGYLQELYEVDLTAGTLTVLCSTDFDDDTRGLRLRENPDLPGTEELCLWYDYSPMERVPIGMAATDGAMPVVLRYAAAMNTVSDFRGRYILADARGLTEGRCTVYLAAYGPEGQLLGAAVLGTAEAGTETSLAIAPAAVPEGAAAVKLITLAEGTETPLASVVVAGS